MRYFRASSMSYHLNLIKFIWKSLSCALNWFVFVGNSKSQFETPQNTSKWNTCLRPTREATSLESWVDRNRSHPQTYYLDRCCGVEKMMCKCLSVKKTREHKPENSQKQIPSLISPYKINQSCNWWVFSLNCFASILIYYSLPTVHRVCPWLKAGWLSVLRLRYRDCSESQTRN